MVHGVAKSWTRLSNFTFIFHFHTLEKAIATHSSVLAWRIPGMGEPGGLPSVGSHRVRHDWSDSSSNITWGKIWQKHWKKKEGNSYLSVLSGWDSDVGVRADRGRGIQVIGADVIQGVAETTAHRTAVIPAKDRQQQ